MEKQTITQRVLSHLGAAWRGIWSGPLTSSSPELARLWASPAASSGVSVGEAVALMNSAFYAAVATIAWDIASLPLKLYKNLPGGGKQDFDAHQLYRLIHDTPNDEMTAFQIRAAWMVNVLCGGNSYVEIVRDGAGRPRQLWHIDPSRVTAIRGFGGKLQYRVAQPAGGFVIVEAEAMLHFRGPSPDGVVGFDTVDKTREALGLAIAAERFGGKYFANGAQLGGILSTAGSELSRKNLLDAVNGQHQGVDRSHKWLVAPEGTKFEPIGINPRDSQMTELREHQVREIARFFRIPVAMIGDLSRATWSNFEQQQLQYYTQCIRPWLVNIEQELSAKLISPMERTQQTIEHVTDGFLRADSVGRADFYSKMVGSGIYTINDCRRLENMPPVAGGDTVRVPMNFEPLTAPEPAPHATPARTAELLAAQRDVILDAMGRIIRKETDRVRRHQTPEKLNAWIEDFYSVHEENSVDALRTAVRTHLVFIGSTQDADAVSRALIHVQIEAAKTQLRGLLKLSTDDYPSALERLLTKWERERPAAFADRLLQDEITFIQGGTPEPVPAGNIRYFQMVQKQKEAEIDLERERANRGRKPLEITDGMNPKMKSMIRKQQAAERQLQRDVLDVNLGGGYRR